MKKESDASSPSPAIRTMKFAPKIPPKKAAKASTPKPEPLETKDDVIDKDLLSKLNSHQGPGRRMSNDRKFSFAIGSDSTKARSFGKPRVGFDDHVCSGSGPKKEKEYVEPWDYRHSYHPVTLPLRRPYMGNPETLDEEEFGAGSISTTALDESFIDPTDELGLLEMRDEAQMFLFQLPKHLPVPKFPNVDVKGKSVLQEEDNTEVGKMGLNNIKGGNVLKGCTLKELPAGFMGKLLVYTSGAIKLKLGETLFDVSPGSDCVFAQDVAAISTEMMQCCIIGELGPRAIVMPNVDSLPGFIEVSITFECPILIAASLDISDSSTRHMVGWLLQYTCYNLYYSADVLREPSLRNNLLGHLRTAWLGMWSVGCYGTIGIVTLLQYRQPPRA
ncbi:hypothetical protein J5N97_022202 [Dioscorea zingiberensis]|uniref:DNA-directed RNA polymerase III subunit RPC4 n=1 Tax=Dioscorea zingiberensis TaxID=325984 RepID=A0A9D5CBG8_9LILI|nr:hypothetical protein J5N97_022202 [Dioscorea zingiberensis]